MTETLLKRLNRSGKLHMVPASLKGKYVIRFTVTSQYTTESDIERDWKIISETTTKVLQDDESADEELVSPDDDVFEKDDLPVLRVPRVTPLKRKDYGISLLLSNVPMSPKLINGSFAALFDNNDVIVEFAKQITNSDFNGRPIRLSPRRRLKLKDSTKQQSLDTIKINRPLSKHVKYGSLDSKIEEILELSSLTDQSTSNGFHDIADIKENELELNQSDDDDQATVEVHITRINDLEESNGNQYASETRAPRKCNHCGHIIE